MAIFELISPYDVLNAGRLKINHAFSAQTNVWSSSTGNYSIIANNYTNNIASSSFSQVLGGTGNTSSGFGSIIVGGNNGVSSGKYSQIVGGLNNQATNRLSSIFGGTGNTASGSGSTIVGGNIGIASGTKSFIGTGVQNTVSGPYSIILGGSGNTITTTNSSITGGKSNSIITTSNYSIIGNGKSNSISNHSKYANIGGGKNNGVVNYSSYSNIGGGSGNTITVSPYSSINGGISNKITVTISPYQSFGNGILSGQKNTISNLGYSTYGNAAIVGGYLNRIKSEGGVVIGGRNNYVIHNYSVAMGGGAKTRGSAGTHQGNGTCQLVIGNSPGSSANVSNNTIRLDGNSGWGISTNGFGSGTADFAENFEWQDLNVSGENRVGYFVSLVDGKIQIGNSNLIGIVSSTPAFLGDAAELSWSNIYMKDVWGKSIISKYTKYSWTQNGQIFNIYEDINGNKFSPYPNPSNPSGITFSGEIPVSAKTEDFSFPTMNPNFDPNTEYVPRSERKEWAPIGLLGKLYVRTAEVITGKTVDVNAQGLAINGTKYNVLNVARPHVDSNQYGIVKIFFK